LASDLPRQPRKTKDKTVKDRVKDQIENIFGDPELKALAAIALIEARCNRRRRLEDCTLVFRLLSIA